MASRPGLDPLHQPLPRTVVPRPALEARLDALGPGDLALVVASAGSGKSVLVRQWAASRSAGPIAALAITPQHDDPVVLARDMIAAIRSAAPQGTADAGTGAVATSRTTLVDELIEEIASLTGDTVLVVEDLHVLSNRSLLEELGRAVLRPPRLDAGHPHQPS